MAMKKRTDDVTDGKSKASDIAANAPVTDHNFFFMAPKVVK